MKISRIIGHIREDIIHLVIEIHILISNVLHCYLTLFFEWHWPVAVECTAWVYRNCQRLQRRIFPPTHAKEIPYWCFNTGSGFIIPVNADDSVSPVACWCHPDMLNASGSARLSYGKSCF